MVDKKYWESFYRSQRNIKLPSTFAKYVLRKYLKQDNTLLELGCGNGRDAFFFASEENIQVTAIDQVKNKINDLKLISKLNPLFINGDFTNLASFNKFDYIYSRFTLHSINEDSENLLFSQLYDRINDNGLFLMEARSKKDENLTKYFSTEHYRRYLDFTETVKKIEMLGFEILEKIEAQNLATYKHENPFVLRIIAQKKN